ncbi:MAG TPA: diaminopimelate decarboxylase [Gammaproteobacteria bacterium]|nr:diaminopimelate decarboxylase [Gammaproteobacteria bacterium]
MDYFDYKNGQLYAEQVSLAQLAEEYGTPLYVYSRATLERHWRAYEQAFADQAHLICYAVKANSSLAVLNVLARLGSGFDIVSGGELARVLRAGGQAEKIVFSGVGKRADEIREALQEGLRCFNVESAAELDRISAIASDLSMQAPVSIRVNPDVDAGTHPYISTGLKENKFGIPVEQAFALYQHAAQLPGIRLTGIDCHIGSQLTEMSPFVDALDRILLLVDRLAEMGITLQHLDLGGGLGIRYRDEQPPDPASYAQAILQHLQGRDLEILIEPGRAIVGNAGVMLTRVEYLKEQGEHHFAIVDAAMNDLLRPSLYSAWQEIIPLSQDNPSGQKACYDIVGPICETGDFLGKQRELCLSQDDLLAVRSAGAYGFTMSSNYNTRPRAAEVMVDGDQYYLVRERETLEDLMRGEHLLS